jgi:class 3 adenylate cyclase
MGLEEDIRKEVKEIFRLKWETREGKEVPEAETIQLGNHAVEIDAAVLYADLVDSTSLAKSFKSWFAAEMYKSYLLTACKIIRDNGGSISAFDGDRVMAIFMGSSKNSAAAKTALRINYAVTNILNPAIIEAYPNTSYRLKQVVGIDSGKLFVARTGIRGSNDLVWVGRAANYAAKLCSIREEGFSTFITGTTFDHLNDASKYGGSPKTCMWEKTIWKATGAAIYQSKWHWSL